MCRVFVWFFGATAPLVLLAPISEGEEPPSLTCEIFGNDAVWMAALRNKDPSEAGYKKGLSLIADSPYTLQDRRLEEIIFDFIYHKQPAGNIDEMNERSIVISLCSEKNWARK